MSDELQERIDELRRARDDARDRARFSIYFPNIWYDEAERLDECIEELGSQEDDK